MPYQALYLKITIASQLQFGKQNVSPWQNNKTTLNTEKYDHIDQIIKNQ